MNSWRLIPGRASIVGLLTLSIAGIPAAILAQETEKVPPPEDESLWEEIQLLYENAKEAGEDVPEDLSDWIQEDLERMGSWEYRVVTVAANDEALLQKRLTKLGRDRWECFWVEEQEESLRLLFKRPSRSYLRMIPLSQLWKLLPGSGDGN